MGNHSSIERQLISNFRSLLSKGNPVAFEEAFRGVEIPDGIDLRTFGYIPKAMAKRGEICEYDYRKSQIPKHNGGIKRLWIVGPNFKKKRPVKAATSTGLGSNSKTKKVR